MKSVAIFPYDFSVDAEFGLVSKPTVRIELTSEVERLVVDSILDSGADITILPLRIGQLLGLRSENGRILEFADVNGDLFLLRLRRVGLRIGNSKIVSVRIGWSLSNDVEVILGRLDVFKHFSFEFNHDKQEIRVKQ